MPWNWQQPDWPNFSWDPVRLRQAEERFLVAGGSFAGTIKHLDDDDREQLVIDAISLEALTTSEIEGEFLDRTSVQSSIRKQLGLTADKRRVRPTEQGIGEMMVDVSQTLDEPLSEEVLCNWHRSLAKGRTNLQDIGRYRTGTEPMQVVSGAWTRQQIFSGKVQLYVGSEEEPDVVSAQWAAQLVADKIYVINGDGDGFLSLSPMFVVRTDPNTKLEHAYLFKAAPKLKLVRLVHDGSGSIIEQAIDTASGPSSFEDWLKTRQEQQW